MRHGSGRGVFVSPESMGIMLELRCSICYI